MGRSVVREARVKRHVVAREPQWRVGDQRWYVSDTRAFQAATGWKPRVAAADGIAGLDLPLGQRPRLHIRAERRHPKIKHGLPTSPWPLG